MRWPGEDRVGESCWGDCWRERSELRVRGSTEGCLRWEGVMDWEETGIPGGTAEQQNSRAAEQQSVRTAERQNSRTSEQ